VNTIIVGGADAGDFKGGRLIWDALNGIAVAKRHAPTTVDLKGLRMVRPYTLATIAALGCLGDRKVELVLPEEGRCRVHVIRAGLLEFFTPHPGVQLEPSPRAVNVKQLDQVSATFADEITRAWEREFGEIPTGLRPRLADHLDEVIRNALTHAESQIGCIVAAQVYPNSRSVEIAILDVGQTIRGHLTKNPEHAAIETDADAIIAATTEGVTGTPAGQNNRLGEPNSGVGLFELRSYCESGGGEVSILSGTAIVTFSSEGEPRTRHFAGGFPGCLVSIKFNV
jgi:hypothetical protein